MSCGSKLFHKCICINVDQSTATRHGQEYEDEAGRQYERITGQALVEHEIGLLVSDYQPILPSGDKLDKRYGATPDRVTMSAINVEIKCPYSREITPEVPIQYIGQLQFQMLVMNLAR